MDLNENGAQQIWVFVAPFTLFLGKNGYAFSVFDVVFILLQYKRTFHSDGFLRTSMNAS